MVGFKSHRNIQDAALCNVNTDNDVSSHCFFFTSSLLSPTSAGFLAWVLVSKSTVKLRMLPLISPVQRWQISPSLGSPLSPASVGFLVWSLFQKLHWNYCSNCIVSIGDYLALFFLCGPVKFLHLLKSVFLNFVTRLSYSFWILWPASVLCLFSIWFKIYRNIRLFSL